VYGRVGTLFAAKDVNKHGVALTEVIGGRIYNVVVESANEAKQILKGSELQQRVTFMPLKDIVSKEVPREIIAKIEELTQGRAKLAIDLLQFDPKFTKIMQQIFG
jgi:structural maintenance of chromosome 2